MDTQAINGNSPNGVNMNGTKVTVTYQDNDKGEIQHRHKIHWLWNRDTIKIIGYLSALVSFILMFNIPGLPKLPYPFIGNLLDWNPQVIPTVWKNGTVLIPLLWGIVYCSKTFVIILSHNCCMCCTKARPLNARQGALPAYKISRSHLAASLICFHIFFGAWIGWATNIHCGYQTSDTEYLVGGCIIFAAGQITYFVINVIRLSRKDTKCLRLLSEIADLVVFSGLAIVSFTMSAFTWLLFRMIISALVLGQLLDTGLF